MLDKKVLSISRGNFIPKTRIIGIFSVDSNPMRRVMADKRDEKMLIDATKGRKTRSAVLLDNGYIILSPINPDTLANNYQQE